MSVFRVPLLRWVTAAASIAIAALLSFDAFMQPDEFVHGKNVPSEAQLNCKRCNLVLLNIELLRADHVGLISSRHALTPVVDRFFENGIHFLDATSTSGATYLSATSTATGTEAMLNSHSLWKMGERTGGGSWKLAAVVRDDGPLLVDRMPSIAEVLRDNGYHTIGINDWIHSGRWVFLDRGYDDYHQMPEFGSLFENQVDTVLDALDGNDHRPFYLYFHSNALHFNFFFPESREPELLSLLGNDLFTEVTSREPKENAIVIHARSRGMPLVRAWDAYKAQIRYVDKLLERLFERLSHSDLANTIVILYAHHGVGSRRDGPLQVGLPYQEFVHVPLLLRHPAVDRALRVESMVSLADLFPTVLDLLGLKSPFPLTTSSMLPLLTGGDYARNHAYTRDLQFESIRDANWKLIFQGGSPVELFSLNEDAESPINHYDPGNKVSLSLVNQFRLKQYEQIQYAADLEEILPAPDSD